MPLFRYRCRTCDDTFEALVRKSEERVSCGACDSEAVDRLLSRPAVQTGGKSLPLATDCPPAEAGPCGAPACCRLP